MYSVFGPVLGTLVVLFTACDRTISAHRSAICAGVPNGMPVRSSRSCSSFVRCINGRPFEQRCPNDLLFSVRSLRCERPASHIDCAECSRYGVQQLADPAGTCHRYVRCVRGFSEVLRCPSGLAFDRLAGDCNHASEVAGCSDHTDDEEAASPCAGLREFPLVHVGDRHDCRRYVVCRFGIESSGQCPPQTYYHSLRGECNALPSSCQGIGPLISATPRPTAAVDQPPDCQQLVASNLPHYLNDVADCQRFYVCRAGVLSSHQCAQRSFYNPYTTQCQPNCPGIGYLVVRPAAVDEQPTVPLPTPGTADPIDRRCRRNTGNFAVAQSCRTYVHCDGGQVLYESDCPTGTIFDEALGRCVPDVNGTCAPQPDNVRPPEPESAPPPNRPDETVRPPEPDRPTPPNNPNGNERPEQNRPDQRCSAIETGYAAIVGSCSDYIYCLGGRVQLQLKCTGGEFFSAALSRCSAMDVPPACRTDQRCAHANGNNVGPSGSCRSYYVCRNGLAESERNCPERQYFDAERRTCGDSLPIGCAADRSDLVAVEQPIERCIRPNGYFREGNSCRRYVYCIRRTVRFEYECDAGTYFDDMETKCTARKPNDCM